MIYRYVCHVTSVTYVEDGDPSLFGTRRRLFRHWEWHTSCTCGWSAWLGSEDTAHNVARSHPEALNYLRIKHAVGEQWVS